MAHRLETGSDWLASHPPGRGELSCALAGVARRVASVLAIAERTYGDRLDAAARFFVEQIFDSE